jgi:RNA polymerase sigma-70 factor (ECF subfamily)
MNQDPEAQLLVRCRRGDSQAWDELFDRYYPVAGRFVCQIGYELAREDVEEICQETFLSVVRNLNNFKGHCKFQTWLFRIAVNKARDHQQRQHAAKRGGNCVTLSLNQEDPDKDYTIDPPSPGLRPDHSLLRQENLALVGQALEQLTESYREILHLRYFGDLSYEEIARVLHMNPKTVSSRLSKSLDKLEFVLKSLLKRADSYSSRITETV